MKKENIVIGLLLFLFGAAVIASLCKAGFSTGFESTTVNLAQSPNIALINIDGPISASSDGAFLSPSGVDAIIDQLLRIEEDKHIKAVVLRVNSPGGTTGASQELYQEIKNFKSRTKMPVIVSIADVGASGAYWISLAGDRIYANPGSLVGSIGVIISNVNLSQLAERYGVSMTTIKSGEYKDLLSSWRTTSPKEKALLQKLVTDIHAQFVAVLIAERKISPEKAVALTDGRIFSGAQAKELGLIDELGGLQEAIAYAAKVGGLKQKPKILIKNKNPMSQFMEFWTSQSQFGLPNLNSVNWL